MKPRILFLPLLLLEVGFMNANRLPFERFTVDEGLPQSSVFSLLQDRSGYLWFGTQNGLSRFNGLEFKTFTRRNGVTDGRVFALQEDRQGRIWVGTQQDGLFVWDGWGWRAFTTREGLPGNAVLAIGEDAAGTIWAGTGRGWARVNGGKALPVRDGPGKAEPPAAGSSFWQDRDGTLWLGTIGSGLWRMNSDGWRVFTVADGLPSLRISAVRRDRRGRLWVATLDHGAAILEGERWSREGDPSGLGDRGVLSMFADREGNLWFGTATGGAAWFDGRNWRSLTQAQGLASDSVLCLLQDQEGNFWFGTPAGASKLSSWRFVTYTTADGLPDNFIWAIDQDKGGTIWAGTNSGGLARLEGNRWSPLSGTPFPAQTLVRALYHDREGAMWVGTNQGAWRLKGGRWEHFPCQVGGANGTVFVIREDGAGGLWIGTNQGAFHWDGRQWHTLTTADGLVDDYIFTIYPDRQGRIWFATRQGLSRLDGTTWRTWTTAKGLPVNQVIDVQEDRKGRIWLATHGGGIVRMDGERLIILSTAEGLSNDFCYFIRFYGDDALVGTNRGLNRYDGRRFRVYTARDGLASSEMNQGAVWWDRQGRLWIGTVGGLTRFDPRLDRPNRRPPPIHITGLRLFETTVDLTGELSFGHKQNFLRFEYLGLSLTHPREVRYRFRLAGLHGNWSETSQRSIAFPYLPPGNFVFEVMARNSDGVWSPRPARLPFTIRPPFWATWWFIVLSVTALLGILYTIRRLEIRAMRNRSQTLKRMVRERTQELEEKSRLLEETNLRLQELDRLKSNFLATVSHELKTPLTSIRAFSEILMDNRTETEEIQLRHLAIINEESERLTRLIEDLLDLSRIESGRVKWNERLLDVRQVLESSAQSSAPLLAAKGMRLEREIQPDLPPVVGDFDRLVQVGMNLLGNAVKFSPVGGRLYLSVRSEDSGGFPRVRVSLADGGIGIPPDQLDQIFERFHQVDSSEARPSGGTGLGLAISREIVRHHGGEIWAENRPAGGAVFHFTLPAARVGSADDPATREGGQPS